MEDLKDSPDPAERRKESIKGWLKDKNNLAFVGILIFAIVIRWYYFVLTKVQPLWWDEAAYGTLARNFVSHAWDGSSIIIGETLIRPPLFPLLWSLLLRIGFGETGIRFLLEFAPSVIAVFFVYLVAKEVYGKRTALISAFIFSALWIHLFYSARLLTNVPALPLIFASVYYFLRSTKDKFIAKYFFISLVLLSFATLIRYPNGLIFFAFLAFLLLTGKFVLVKNAKFWSSGIFGLFPIFLFFIYNYLTQGNIFPALLGGSYAKPVSQKIAFHVLNFIPVYLKTVFLVFFILGLGLAALELGLRYDRISKSQRMRGHLILMLIFLVIFSYFIFKIRGAEDRWLFPASLALVCFSGIGIDYVYRYLRKYSKHFAVILVLAVLLFGAYQQLNFADQLIKNKKGSFLQMRQGFEWLKENSPENSIILGSGIEVYSVYYAERMYQGFPPNSSEIDALGANYLVVHSFSSQPDYLNDYLQQSQGKWEPVNAFFFDAERKQPALIIYQSVDSSIL